MAASSDRIVIVGTGALGGLYGGLLARSGQDVHFLLRSDFDHVSRHGLRVDSVQGDFVLDRVQGHSTPDSVPPCPVAVVCLKATHNDVLPIVLPRVLEPGATVVLLQNGLGEEERIARIDGVGAIISALGFVCATKVGPGHVQHVDYGAVRLAEYRPDRASAGVTPLLKSIGSRFEQASIRTTLAADWLEARWKKLVWNVPFNGLTVTLKTDTGQLVGHPRTRALVRELMLEVTAAAATEGREIHETFVDRMLTDTAAMRPYLPSMRMDFDTGRPMEIEAMYRVPVERGVAGGAAMPRTAMLAAELEFLAQARETPPNAG